MRPLDVFLLPGRVIAWIGFMFPGRGQLWASARRKDSPFVHGLFSVAFYGILIAGIGSALTPDTPAQPVSAAFRPAPAVASVASPLPTPQPLEPVAERLMEPSHVIGSSSAPIGAASPVASEPMTSEPVSPGAPTLAELAIPRRGGELALNLRVALMRDSAGTRTWTDPAQGLSGVIVVGEPSQRGGDLCRGYSYTVVRGAEIWQSPDLTACADANGTWPVERD